jgi:hypothetical protein
MSEPVKVKGMGLLNAVNIAGTLIQAGQYSKLKSLEQQGQMEELQKLFLSYLRDAIFKIKSNADNAVSLKEIYPKYSVSALRLLSKRLNNSSIKVENFGELSDKEYVLNTIKFIQSNEAETNLTIINRR